MQTQKKLEVSRPAGNEKTIKQLLGELYGDRQYLEKLLKETGGASRGELVRTPALIRLTTYQLNLVDCDIWNIFSQIFKVLCIDF